MIRKWLTFLIHSHLFLMISTFVFSVGILKWNYHSINFSIALSLAVFGIYNLNRLNKLRNNQLPSEFRLWYEQNQVVLRFSSVFCLFISALCYFYLLGQDLFSLILFGSIGLIAIFYIFSIKRINLRQIPSTKAFWISFVWTIIAIVIPKMSINSFNLIDLHYFILFFALTIPGDIRDCDLDNTKMKTIPQLIGNQKAEFMFYTLITLFLFLDYLIEQSHWAIIVPFFLLSLLLLQKRSIFRYELMDGLLLIIGVFKMIS